MALARGRRRHAGIDYWPGFVDALSTLLLVVTFLMSIFMVAQHFVSQEASGKDAALNKLNRQIAELTSLLSLSKSSEQNMKDELAALQATLGASEKEKRRLLGLLNAEGDKGSSAGAKVAAITSQLDEQKQISAQALAQVELLNQQIAALRRQIGALEKALEASEKQDKESQARIADLGHRLNVALAKKVEELSQYRSTFFGELRKILGARDDIQIVGDRFVFQAEVLFDSGSAEINPQGIPQLEKLAMALQELEGKIPPQLNWVLRIDGHTDIRPINTAAFRSNWELSTARAISVVKYLIAKGVSPIRLAAAGFGEHQPLGTGMSEADLRKNRRIELKLTEK